MDPRYKKLAENLAGYSMDVQPGERVLIDNCAAPTEMVLELMRAVRKRGGRPFVKCFDSRVRREFIAHGTRDDFEAVGDVELQQIQQMQCYAVFRGSYNTFEMSDVPVEQQQIYFKATKPSHEYRVNKTKWVLLEWPTSAMAQSARMSTEAFEEFFFRVCTLDYGRMKPGIEALQSAMQSADRVEIKGPGTDLQFSIRGIPAVPCIGERNIPDGEVFTAPIRDSVEGTLSYNTRSIYHGKCFENIRFTFRKGKIVEAIANDAKTLNEILDGDEGARYIGEFSFGFNPHILEPICDTLFDEKIAGSFHFTPGNAYENEADNGNRSQIHWDLVCIQRPEYGGGEIYFDGKLIRKDGLFVVPGLDKLNPPYLLSDE
ncbi:MAG: aminopeptidase [Puniceicoccales bacterium]|jgi:aminopeptidase|nr:aminopeptidase [Puniceicoccales bacterium]